MEDINKAAELVEAGIEPSKKEADYVMYLKNEASKHYIYSKYNPRKTAKELIDFENVNEETVWILFGMGLGYVIEEILEVAGAGSKIIVIEPTEELLETQRPYIKQLLEDKRISIFCGSESGQLNKLLECNIKVKDINNIKVIVQPVYRSYFKQYYQYILGNISEYIENLKVTYNTLKAFSCKNLNNLIQNEESIKNSYDMCGNKDKYKDIPAVIVSAGPSLKKNIDELKNFKGIILTGTRSLPAVKEAGVEPDYLVCVDPGEIACDIMRNHKENAISLIATEEASPEVVRNNSGQKYFVKGMANGLSKTLYGVDVPKLPLYGSVATLCLSAAQFMGCNPIIFIGQDLAYTNARAHADDYSSYQVDLEDKHIRYVQGIDGQMIPTDVTLLSYLRWIESFIEENSRDTKYINCTEGGANIRGTETIPFKEAVEKYHRAYAVKENDAARKVSGNEKLKEAVIVSLKDYMKILQDGIQYSEALQKLYECHEAEVCQGRNYANESNQKISQMVSLLEEKVNSKLQKGNDLFEMIFTIERLKLEVELDYKGQCHETSLQKDLKNVKKFLELYRNTYDAIHKILEVIGVKEDE